jgi:hypothetical protein
VRAERRSEISRLARAALVAELAALDQRRAEILAILE